MTETTKHAVELHHPTEAGSIISRKFWSLVDTPSFLISTVEGEAVFDASTEPPKITTTVTPEYARKPVITAEYPAKSAEEARAMIMEDPRMIELAQLAVGHFETEMNLG